MDYFLFLQGSNKESSKDSLWNFVINSFWISRVFSETSSWVFSQDYFMCDISSRLSSGILSGIPSGIPPGTPSLISLRIPSEIASEIHSENFPRDSSRRDLFCNCFWDSFIEFPGIFFLAFFQDWFPKRMFSGIPLEISPVAPPLILPRTPLAISPGTSSATPSGIPSGFPLSISFWNSSISFWHFSRDSNIYFASKSTIAEMPDYFIT